MLRSAPNVLVRVLQYDYLNIKGRVLDALGKHLEDLLRGYDILHALLFKFGPFFCHCVECVHPGIAAWEIDLAWLVDHDEAEGW